MVTGSRLGAQLAGRSATMTPMGAVYLRVLEDLRDQIRGGLLAPGDRVPSRNAIIAKYGVGETAAKHALQVLAAEGLIQARAGSGSYVRRLPAPAHLEHDRPHFPGSPFGLDGLAGDGDQAPSPRLSWEYQSDRVVPPGPVARRLGLADRDQPVTRTRYLMSADGAPVQLATSYEPDLGRPPAADAAGRSVTDRMRAIGITVDQVVEEISVRPALSAEAAVLGLLAGAPVLVIDRAHQAGPRTVEVGEVVIAADRFRLRYRFPV